MSQRAKLLHNLPTCHMGIIGFCEIIVQYRYLSMGEELRPSKWIENQLFSINSSVAVTIILCVHDCLLF